MKQSLLYALPLIGAVVARPGVNRYSFTKREVPQEHAHRNINLQINDLLALNNPDEIQDAVFGLLGAKAAAEGAGNIADADCLQQAAADQAFTNALDAGDVDGMVSALIYRALERNSGSVGEESPLCESIQAVNPEIAALQQHQDPAGDGAQDLNKEIASELARQIAAVGGDPTLANEASTFEPGEIGDETGAGNTCDDEADDAGCINTLGLRVDDLSEDEILAAVDGAGAGGDAAAAGDAADAGADAQADDAAAGNDAAADQNADDAAAAGNADDAEAAQNADDAEANQNADDAEANQNADDAQANQDDAEAQNADDAEADQNADDAQANQNEDDAEANQDDANAQDDAEAAQNEDDAQANQDDANAQDDAEAAQNEDDAQANQDDAAAADDQNANQDDAAADQNQDDAAADNQNADDAANQDDAAAADDANAQDDAAAAGEDAAAGAGADAAADFGSCADPTIVFGIPSDGRNEDAFEAADLTNFAHGSALNIGVISQFICDQLVNKCEANQAAVDTCDQADAAAQGLEGQDAADAFNAALGF